MAKRGEAKILIQSAGAEKFLHRSRQAEKIKIIINGNFKV